MLACSRVLLSSARRPWTYIALTTPAAIKEHVRRQVEIWSPGGGFVFQQVHNILADVPPQNIVAMYDAVKLAKVSNKSRWI